MLLIATALVAGIVPAGLIIDRRLARELESRARDELTQAPRLVADRQEAGSEGLVMHARDVARAAGLVAAMVKGDSAAAVRIVRAARGSFGDGTVLVTSAGRVLDGPAPGAPLLEATRRGETPVSVLSDSGGLKSVAIAPIIWQGKWLGAAGITISLGRPAAGVLAALTRSDVLILGSRGALTTATTTDATARLIAQQALRWPRDKQVREVTDGAQRYLMVTAPVGDAGTLVFVRDLTRDLAVLPMFRRAIVLSGVAALLLGLLLGTFAAFRVAQPVSVLADAADRLAGGDVDAPLMRSGIREIDRLAVAFAAMRTALAARMEHVERANREFAERQARLETLQSELLQRERLAVSARLVAELSHEIRNPIANLRNCLEIVRRRIEHDPQGREFTDLAIDELLRMHELAEQMLYLNRPRDPSELACRVEIVAREVSALASAGMHPDAFMVTVASEGDPVAALAPDSLKQVLLTLVQNSREAILADRSAEQGRPGKVDITISQSGGTVSIDVIDNGSGIPADVLSSVFDPFFTTKGAVDGVGLGLFVAQGLVRTAGGRLTATNRADDVGAHFHIELPASTAVDVVASPRRLRGNTGRDDGPVRDETSEPEEK
ncbi:MAG: HAMP domain-containing histidine kinase [Gemmatimonadaceae bacterium]|nr:HAMP domain-containing histidine kinase [Gemmatimonadaceae bacterium]